MEHASLLWIQIPTENLKRAADFYKEVFGFEFFYETLNNIPHAVFKELANGKKPVNGALIEVKEKSINSHGCVLFFDATGRFGEITKAIEENSGKILIGKTLIKKPINEKSSLIPKTYINDEQGYFAHFIDSEGNKMGLYGSY